MLASNFAAQAEPLKIRIAWIIPAANIAPTLFAKSGVAKNLGKKVTMIYPDFAFGYDHRDYFSAAIKAQGGEAIKLIPIPPTESSFTRYFPELLGPIREQFPARCVIDGEIVAFKNGRPDFSTLKDAISDAGEMTFFAFDLLELVRRDAERIYVGKARANHTLPQEDINQLMVRLASEGRRVKTAQSQANNGQHTEPDLRRRIK